MAIPTYDQLMLPLLKGLADGEEHELRTFYSRLADAFGLSQQEQSELLPSGQQRVFHNRVGWWRTYLKKAGLVSSPKRGRLVITEEGRQLLAANPDAITLKTLDGFESFREFKSKRTSTEDAGEAALDTSATPDETIEGAFKQHIEQVRSDLLDTVKKCSPYFFEKVVVVLLRAMGYGGVGGRGHVTPKSSDGGIDGVIYEDKLGLDTVCIQAKRWEGTVGRQHVQAFVGSMDLHRSRKGVVLTTGRFSHDAVDYVERIEGKKVVLIDGEQLARLMVDYRVGVTVTKAYELVDISQDFFDEES